MKTIRTSSRGSRSVLGLAASLIILTGTAMLSGADNPAPSENKKWDYTALSKAPAKAKARSNPLGNDPDAVAAGKKLFGAHCAECHGKDAGGARRGPSLRVVTTQEATPGALFYVLTNGVVRHGMPGWGKLPPSQRWQLVSFLKSLRDETK
jgi:mono/diheme cytochrome c family protein